MINTNKASKNYLLQTLNNVYVAPRTAWPTRCRRTHFLVPTGNGSVESRMTTAKRQTLADFLFYSVCAGQKEIGPIGYSPLPSNLVQASFQQTVLLHAADPAVDVSQEENTSLASCDNPTFDPGHLNDNHLAGIAPLPAACMKYGAGPCANNEETATSGGGVATGGSGGTGGTGGTLGGTGTAMDRAVVPSDAAQRIRRTRCGQQWHRHGQRWYGR